MAPNCNVEQKRMKVRQYEQCHDKFLNYKQICEYLRKMEKEHPKIVRIEVIGTSKECKNIYMAVLYNNPVDQNTPRFATMIEAGSNGEEWTTISTALNIMDNIVKKPSPLLLCDFLIIPCMNPDAYEKTLCNLPPGDSGDLSRNFPVLLGHHDLQNISTRNFICAAKIYKENLQYNAPAVTRLIQAITSFGFAVRLYISLQCNGENICYPFGSSDAQVGFLDQIKTVALAGTSALKQRCVPVGSLYKNDNLTFGSIIDFIENHVKPIRFKYIINLHKKSKGQMKEGKYLVEFADNFAECVKAMARCVFKIYNKNIIEKKCN